MEKRKYYNFRANIEDMQKISVWSTTHDLTVPYCIRRAIKDFIVKYVETNTMPPAEKVNYGAILGKEEKILGAPDAQ